MGIMYITKDRRDVFHHDILRNVGILYYVIKPENDKQCDLCINVRKTRFISVNLLI